MYYVYIIQSKKDYGYYTGRTKNLQRRLKDHNQGLVKYTSSKRPYIIIWYCGFTNKDKSIAFEKYLKSGSGHAFARKRLR